MRWTTTLTLLLGALGYGWAGCASGGSGDTNASQAQTGESEAATPVAADDVAEADPEAEAEPEAEAAPRADAKPPAEAEAPPEPVPAAPSGRDFIAEARTLYRVGACGDGEIPEGFREAFVTRHCKRLDRVVAAFDDRWLTKAKPFFAELVPDEVPKTVVYPFGGGDLVSALAVFSDFDELTTLSLEPAGDPRGITELERRVFEDQMERTTQEFSNLVHANHNKTKNMIEFMRQGKLPAHLTFTLTALRVHGFEPVSVHYFEIEEDGRLRYLTAEDIDAFEEKDHWRKRNQFFGNVEVRFSRPGEDRVRIYRHIQGDLSNDYLEKDPRVLEHLKAKGDVTAMTKAASFLLWWGSFSMVRDYLLDNMVWMVSDATGIPPRVAEEHGFEQITWGKFTGPILTPGATKKEFIALWKKNPYQPLSFRFGYPDKARNHHLMVTRKK